MYKRNEKNIAVIDFDWAGYKDEVKYPLWMNPDIEWPKGATPGHVITSEHDNYWLKKLKDELQQHSVSLPSLPIPPFPYLPTLGSLLSVTQYHVIYIF